MSRFGAGSACERSRDARHQRLGARLVGGGEARGAGTVEVEHAYQTVVLDHPPDQFDAAVGVSRDMARKGMDVIDDRTSDDQGTRLLVRVALGWRRLIQQTKHT